MTTATHIRVPLTDHFDDEYMPADDADTVAALAAELDREPNDQTTPSGGPRRICFGPCALGDHDGCRESFLPAHDQAVRWVCSCQCHTDGPRTAENGGSGGR